MRNLLLRIAVAAVGIPLLLFVLSRGGWMLLALVILLQLGMLVEWRALWRARQTALSLPGLAFATVALDLLVLAPGSLWRHGIATLAIGGALLLETFRARRQPLRGLGGIALFALYVALPLALWMLVDQTPAAARFAPAGALLTLFVATWMCDSGAYFTGRALGRHKLYPAASPNKTWEGFVGGAAAAAIVVPAFGALGWNACPPLDYVAMPVIVGLIGQSGDLLESLMKREAGVKDTSALLPGHGGLLDRFDSLLLSTLFFYAYLLLAA